jgi:hypothetical protein
MSVENSNLYTTMVPKLIWGAPGTVGLHRPKTRFQV